MLTGCRIILGSVLNPVNWQIMQMNHELSSSVTKKVVLLVAEDSCKCEGLQQQRTVRTQHEFVI